MTHEQFTIRERALCNAAEHCVSVIALCCLNGSTRAELSCEQRLAQITADLAILRSDKKEQLG